jgi:NAD(P)-dependent dehydrogenase (short-subunit alcohol dehydrogenase family)
VTQPGTRPEQIGPEEIGPEGTRLDSRRVALVSDASTYVGPHIARALAARGHDLVLGDAPDELVDELTRRRIRVEAVPDVRSLRDAQTAQRLVTAGLDRFGRVDAALAFSGRVITGRFLDRRPTTSMPPCAGVSSPRITSCGP